MKKLAATLALFAIAGSAGGFLVLRAKHRRTAPVVEAAASAGRLPSWGPFEDAEVIYNAKLIPGWIDWGWGPHQIPKEGPAKVVLGGYGGIIFRHDLLTGHYGLLSFRFKAPADWTDFLMVTLKTPQSSNESLPEVEVDTDHTKALPDGWREVRLDMAQLNPSGVPFDRILIGARSNVGSDWVSFDRVVLSKPVEGAPLAAAPQRAVALVVSCSGEARAISPLIYGSSNGDWDSGLTASRIGGNPTSRFNWELGAWNSAKDWFFENGKSIDLAGALDETVKHQAFSALTVPLIGWVAKDTSSAGFPKAKFAEQHSFDPNRSQAGDGLSPDGKPITPGSPTLTSIPAPPELIGRWIRALRDKDRSRGSRGVQMYILDNEPGLWNSTHRDVHPDPVGYDELLDRTVRYAAEIRRADPEALIAGPAEWGWLNYNYSAKDNSVSKFVRPDRRAHGDIPLIPWYLAQIAVQEQATGTRLLDYLDVHFYPAGDRVYGENGAVDDSGRALRLRATRSLWDPDYVDESWINEKIRLIPRLREWVSQNHPGLKISIGEWSFGGEHDISGVLATAESLGRFGQYGLDAAFYWDGPKRGTSSYWAFRAFRNFDGNGGRFLDEALETRGEEQVSIFASRDPKDHAHLVVIVINRDPIFGVNARIDLASCGQPTTYREFGFSADSSSLKALAGGAHANSGLTVSVPPYSLQVVDVTLRHDDKEP